MKPVLATFRPRAGDILVSVDNGGEHASIIISVDEARSLHATLGNVLRLADSVDDPIAAVGGFAAGGR